MATVLRYIARYGSNAVNWVRANGNLILHWLNVGQTVDWIVNKIKSILGLR